MKQYRTQFLFIALLLIVMSNTAFIISPKVDVNVATTTINTQAPPQYKAPEKQNSVPCGF